MLVLFFLPFYLKCPYTVVLSFIYHLWQDYFSYFSSHMKSKLSSDQNNITQEEEEPSFISS